MSLVLFAPPVFPMKPFSSVPRMTGAREKDALSRSARLTFLVAVPLVEVGVVVCSCCCLCQFLFVDISSIIIIGSSSCRRSLD